MKCMYCAVTIIFPGPAQTREKGTCDECLKAWCEDTRRMMSTYIPKEQRRDEDA